MCFKNRSFAILLLAVAVSCTQYKVVQKFASGQVAVGLAVPGDEDDASDDIEAVIDSISGNLPEGPVIMNAIRDSETGEMVATDVINASKVTARFRNVSERAGYVSIGFDVTVPAALSRSAWKLELFPMLVLQGDTTGLETLCITGSSYREAQLRGYQRYNRFLESIITDSSDFVRIGQLEIFLARHFPQTYAMKTDSSFVSEPMAENLFGVTQYDALMHYKKKWKQNRNDRKIRRKGRMYARYIKDPIISDGVRLDTVLSDGTGFTYRYSHRFRSRPNLKKAVVFLDGRLYERGELILNMPRTDDMTFYISSLSTLADRTVKYKLIILERTVYDNTKALIDFEKGCADIDTSMSDNASELLRIRKCLDDVTSREDLILDSLVISASCSPEGTYRTNEKLALSRSESVCKYISEYIPAQWKNSLKVACVPENWRQLRLLVRNDSVMSAADVSAILRMTDDLKRPDQVEKLLETHPQYRYIREKLYPKLRAVSFDFYLHRAGMVKDTVHTTEVDTLYMQGLEALENLDYKRAVTLLRPYRDYNSALAFVSAEYNHSALEILQQLDTTDPKVCYLTALVLSRLGQKEAAKAYFRQSLLYAPHLRYRANLDPEMSMFQSEIEDEYL